MFSAMKKLAGGGNSGGNGSGGSNGGVNHGGGNGSKPEVSCLSQQLQKKFSKGVNYNMKLIIRGDVKTGKSTLFGRLQGQKFSEDYVSSPEISVCSIEWNYKATEDIVKVEIWDVVDKAKKRNKIPGLLLEAGDSSKNYIDTALDAEFVDVYKGTHGVVLIFDMTKQWTYDYVTKEIEKIPGQIPVLILANFADMSHHRVVSRDQVTGFIQHVKRREVTIADHAEAEIRYAESSMRNGFGLKFLHKFLNLPFLSLQRFSLLRQLETNERDILATRQELDFYMESDEANYDRFSDGLTKNRRSQAERQAPTPTIDVVVGQLSNSIKTPEKVSTKLEDLPVKPKQKTPSPPPPQKPTPSPPQKPAPSPQPSSIPPTKSPKSPNKKIDVLDFIPSESSNIDNFLDDNSESTTNQLSVDGVDESSSEDDGANVNTLVASFNDDVEIDEYNDVTPSAIIHEEPQSSDSDDAKPVIKQPPKNNSKPVLLLEEEPDVLVSSSPEVPDEKSKKKKKHKKKHKKKSREERNSLEEFLNGGSEEKQTSNYEEL